MKFTRAAFLVITALLLAPYTFAQPTADDIHPEDDATSVGKDDDLLILFDETVAFNGDATPRNIVLDDMTGSNDQTITVTAGVSSGGGTAAISGTDARVLILNFANLTNSSDYELTIPAGLVIGDVSTMANASFGGASWSFTSGTANDGADPTVSSVNRLDPSPTTAADVNFRITFSEAVVPFAVTELTVTTASGSATGTENSIAYTTAFEILDVNVNSVTGDGDLRLDVTGGATILDPAGNDLTAGFTGGQVYVIDNTPPAILGGSVAADNTYIDVFFDDGVYKSNGSSPLDGNDFAVSMFNNNGGPGTTPSIPSATKVTGGALTGGETAVRVNLSGFGNPSGVETFEVGPMTTGSIHDDVGNPITPITLTTGTIMFSPPNTILRENFEDDGQSTRYTASEFEDDNDDFYLRLPSSDVKFNSAPSNFDGDWMFLTGKVNVASNPNIGGLTNIGTVELDPITITGLANMEVKMLIGAATAQYESADPDFFRVMADVDGGGFMMIGNFLSNSGSNGTLERDDDLTGGPDGGATLGLAMADFAFPVDAVVGTGNTLKIRIESNNNSGSGLEQTFFDNIRVIAVSAESDIIANAGFSPPENIGIASYGSAGFQGNQGSGLTTANTLEIAQFDIRDGGTGGDTDSNPTTLTDISFTVATLGNLNAVGLFDGSTLVQDQTVAGTTTFSGISVMAADEGSKTFSLRVTFDPSGVTDNEQFSFTVNSATADAAGSDFAAGDAGGAASLTAGNDNQVEVSATEYAFSALDASQFINNDFAATVQAQDADGNVDLDDGSSVTLSTATGAGTLSSVTGLTQTIGSSTAGEYAWTDLQENAPGGHTLQATGALTTGTSGTITINATDNDSDIIDAGGTSDNIDYASFQENSDLTIGTSVSLFDFTIRDGGASAPDADPLSTTLTDITFSITNDGFLRRLALYDGVTELAEAAVSGNSISFSSLTAAAADDGTKTLTLRASFTTAVVDNQQVGFTITSATADAAGSDFATGDAGGAASSTTGDANRIEVTATDLIFSSYDASAFINTNFNATVQAVDGLNNLDLDETSSVTVVKGSGPAGILTSGSNLMQSLVGGTYSWADLQFDAAGVFTLDVDDAGGLNLGSTGNITVTVSSTSDIIDAGGTTDNIDYASFQENSDLIVANSVSLFDFTIRDGGASAPDADPLATTLTDITFSITNDGFLRRLALYDGVTELAEAAVSGNSISFSSLTAAAADNGIKTLTLRGSFTTAVTDNQQVGFTITSATASAAGSDFGAGDAGGAASSTAGDANRIEVTATKLEFASFDTPVATAGDFNATVEARDGNDVVDLDNSAAVSLSQASGPGGFSSITGFPQNLIAGSYTWTDLQFDTPGIGVHTLDATGGGLIMATTGFIDVVSPDALSDVIAAGGETSNIDYASFQENSDLTMGTSVSLFDFTIRDGGVSAPDGDPLPTILDDVTFNIANGGFLRRLAIYDGPTELAEIAAGGPTATFTNLGASAPDNGTLTLTLRGSFTTAVTDNAQSQFAINSAVASTGGSGFALPDAGGALSSVAGDANRIEVAATKLLFVQVPTTTTINTAMSPAVTIEATDGFNNRDLDQGSVATLASTGSLAGASTAAVTAGFGTYTAIIHDATGTNRMLTASLGGLTDAISGNFNIDPGSALSDIIAAGGTTANIAYASFQENSDLTLGTSVSVFSFTIRDGGAAFDPDPLGTILTDVTFGISNDAYVRRLAVYNGAVELAEAAVSGNSISFSGLSATAPDNGTLTLTLRASFTTAVLDNSQIQFNITSATASGGGSTFAAGDAGGAVSSIAGDDNRIEVTSTTLAFVQQPSLTLGGVTMAPSPTVEAIDGFANRDLDRAGTVAISSTGALSGSPTAILASGLGTASAIVHTAVASGRMLMADLVSHTTGNSNLFNITSSSGSDLILLAAFPAPTDIDYLLHQGPDITGANTFFVSVFEGRDGGAGPDADGLGTTLTDITFSVSNPGNIRRIALYDQTLTELGEVAGSGTATFTGFNFPIADDGSYQFAISVLFNTTVTDNEQFSFTVTSVTSNPAGSGFAAGDGGGAVTSTLPTENTVRVTSDRMAFIQQPTTTFVSTTMAPAVTMEAVDINGSRDLDRAGTASLSSSGVLTGEPLNVTITNGFGTAPALVHTSIAVGYQLTASLPAHIAGTSGLFNIDPGSALSDIVENGGFTYPTNIDYASKQAADIIVDPNSIEVARFDIRDGGAGSDPDGLSTTITDITFALTNAANVRSVAIYDGVTELGEVAGGAVVTFNGLSIAAGDNGSKTFNLRVSFNAPVTDNQQIQFSVASATASSLGSTFAAGDAGGAATSVSGNDNRIEVTATQLDFTIQPAATSINTPFATPPQVSARDILMSVDMDFAEPVGVLDIDDGGSPLAFDADNTTGGANDPLSAVQANFINGVYTFDTDFVITQAGDGTDIDMTLPDAATGGYDLSGSPAVSNLFDIIASEESQVKIDPTFTFADSLLYIGHQAVDIMGNDGMDTVLARFLVVDGDGVTPDIDGAGTELTDITFNLTNSGNLRQIALYDGSNNEIGTEQAAGPTVTFSGLSVIAPDNGSTPFSVRASFQTTVTDNDTIQLEVTSVTDGSGSKFAPLFNVAANSGFQNDFDPSNWTPTIQNTDGAVNLAGVPNSINLVGGNDGIAPGTELIGNGNFETGSLSPFVVPSGNWFNVGPIGGPFGTADPAAIGGGFRQAYQYFYIAGTHQMYQEVTVPAGATATLQWYDFIQWQEPTPGFPSRIYTATVRNTSNGVLQTLYNLTTPIGPASGSTGWQFHSLDLSAYAGQTVRIFFETIVPISSGFGLLTVDRVTLQVQDINPGNTDYVHSGAPADGLISFDWTYGTGDGRGQAVDPAGYLVNGGFTNLSSGGSFGSQAVPVTAGDNLGFRVQTTDGHSGQANMTVSNLVFTPGSGFPAPETPDSKNLINVVATSLDFTTLPDDGRPFDPEIYLGVDSTFAVQPVLEARDANANLDINFNKNALFSNTDGVPFAGAPGPFVQGVLDFSTTGNYRYLSTGTGTFDVDANGINVQSSRLEVIQTDVNTVVKGVSGQPGAPALQGDTILSASQINKTILGFQLNTSKGFLDDDVDQPLVDQVRIDFASDIGPVFRDIRLYRSSDDSIAFIGPSQDELIATVADPSGPTFSVTFTGLSSALDLEMDNNVADQTFFVVVNVAPSVWANTPIVTPFLDNSFNDPGLGMTSGGVFGNVVGFDYYFKDIQPPEIVSLTPPNGEINVNPALDFILEFSEPVIPLDSMIDVYKIDGFNEIFIATIRLDDPGGGGSVDSTTFTFPNPGGILGNDTVYFVRLAVGDTALAAQTGFVDRTGNPFPGFDLFTDWSFKTSDNTPPIFLGPDSVQAINILDLGFEIKARIDEPGEIFFIVVDNGDPVPDSSEIKNEAKYLLNNPAATVHFSDSIDIALGNKYVYAGILGLTNNTDYDVYFTAQDLAQPTPNLMTDAATVKLNVMTLNSVAAGVIIFTDDLDICIGDFQKIRSLSLIEGAVGDFGTGAGQTLNLVLPEGFVFNTDSGTVASFALSGTADVDPLSVVLNYINNTTLRLTYDVNPGTNGRDVMVLERLEINATGPIESTFSGDILRIGGTAIQNNNAEADARSHGLLTTVGTGQPIFISDPPFTSAIPDNIGKVALRVPLGTENFDFTGPGVFEDTLFVEIVGVGDHDVTLTVTDEFGCISSRTETFQIIDNESAIAGLDATYCRDDSPDLIFSTEKPNNTLLDLTFIKTNRFTGDTLDANPPGLTLNASDYLFEPTVADSGRYIFQATYFNSDIGENEVFNQVVFVFVPPTLSGFVIEQPTRPVFNATSAHFCRDDGDLTVTPLIDFADGDGQTDIFTYVIDDGTGIDADPVADLGFTVDNNGILIMNMDDLANFFGLSNATDQIPITIELTYEDINICSDVRDTIIMLNELPDLVLQVSNVGPVGTIFQPQYCIDADPILIIGLDDSVAVNDGIYSGDGINDNGNGTAQFTPRLAAEINGTQTVPNSENSIGFTYTDAITGCFNSTVDTLVVQPLPTVSISPAISGTGDLLDTYCFDATALLINGTGTSAAGRDTSVFYLDGTLGGLGLNGLTDNGDETAIFDARSALVSSGDTTSRTPFEIVLTFTDQNQCVQSDTVNVQVQPLPLATFTVNVDGIQSSDRQFCVNDESIIQLSGIEPLGDEGNLSALGEFFGTAGNGQAVDDGGSGVTTADYFATAFRTEGLTAQLVDVVRYEFTDELGCKNSSTQTFTLDPLPLPSFVIDSVCSKEVVGFLADPTIASSDGDSLYTWNFGELGAGDTTFSTPVAMNEFGDAGLFDVSLRITTSNGCVSDEVFTSPILVGSIPEPRIRWENVCAGNQTFFNGTPRPQGLPLNIQAMLNEVVEQYIWDFGDGTTATSDTNIINHTFPDDGDYNISLRLITNTTCDTMITRTVSILPTITPDGTSEYLADFTTTGSGWRAESQDPLVQDSILVRNSTWALGTINHPGVAQDPSANNIAWVTNPVGDYESEENSWVNSPCFNITQLERPMVAVDTWIDTDAADGAIVQYSIDGGRDWQLLRVSGDSELHESGINWFNRDGINAVPGEINNDPRFGWSIENSGWRSSKHRLDEISEAGKTEVRFRMAFASVFRNQAVDKVGFAFDDFFIGERDRLVLLEQFTNGSLAENSTANTDIKELLDDFSSDMVSISYHTDFPEPDEFNEANPLDPSGRRAYYNVPVTPFSFIDGGFNPGESAYGGNSLDENSNLTFDESDIRRRSLTEPMFDIDVTLPASGPDEVTVDVQITALSPIDVRTRTQIAIIERVITGVNTSNGETEFRNVLRKLLPDAGGINNLGPANPDQFATGESYQVPTQNWKIRNVLNPDQLAVVVFVQSDREGESVKTEAGRFLARREVFQAALLSVTGKQVVTATSEEELLEFLLSDLLLYPNPADNQMTVLFNTMVKEELVWKVIDLRGVEIAEGAVTPGISEFSIDTQNYPSGLYNLFIGNSNLEFQSETFVIRH